MWKKNRRKIYFSLFGPLLNNVTKVNRLWIAPALSTLWKEESLERDHFLLHEHPCLLCPCMVDGAMLFSGISIMTSLTLIITSTFQDSGFLSFLDVLTNTERQSVFCITILWWKECICVHCVCRSVSVSLCVVAGVCMCSLLIAITGVYLRSSSGGGGVWGGRSLSIHSYGAERWMSVLCPLFSMCSLGSQHMKQSHPHLMQISLPKLVQSWYSNMGVPKVCSSW